MIKFFRHIRQRLLGENKFSKYLLYAIGEIVLVMIGILLALQINNWNQQQQQKNEELKQLKALKLEFEKNAIILDSITILHTENEDATLRLINRTNNYSIIEFDSLYFKAVYNYNFDPSKGIYNSLINSGNIELISNETLKYKLAEIQDIVSDYINDENNVREYCFNELFPYVVSKMPYNPFRFYKNRNENEKELHHSYSLEMLNNRVFIEHLTMIRAFRIGVFNEGKTVRKEYNNIISLINQEITQME
jgi:type II secretory pathway pseudopilin PulG